MKRCIVFMVLACLLLTACTGGAAPSTDPQTGMPTEPTGATTNAPTGDSTPTGDLTPTDAPSSPDATTQTVYLLEQAQFRDSGSMTFSYDDQYNVVSYVFHSMEHDVLFEGYFENPDANGMPQKHRVVWPDGGSSSKILTYFADGKMESEQEEGSNYSGYQYEYDAKGDLIEKREYYDGILQSMTLYDYDGETLANLVCEDAEGRPVFDTLIEDGRVIEEYHYGYDTFSYRYEYDQNGNMIARNYVLDGESMRDATLTYKAVEVDGQHAYYLLSQQQYLLTMV